MTPRDPPAYYAGYLTAYMELALHEGLRDVQRVLCLVVVEIDLYEDVACDLRAYCFGVLGFRVNVRFVCWPSAGGAAHVGHEFVERLLVHSRDCNTTRVAQPVVPCSRMGHTTKRASYRCSVDCGAERAPCPGHEMVLVHSHTSDTVRCEIDREIVFVLDEAELETMIELAKAR